MISGCKPLDRAFNVAVIHMANRLFPTGFDVSSTAPDTFEKLKAHVATTGRMCVWSGASDATIFDDAEVNWAFRAWHDFCHVFGNYDFTFMGELNAALMMAEQLREVYGCDERSQRFVNIIMCEVVGQTRHFMATGEFVQDQMTFARDYLAGII